MVEEFQSATSHSSVADSQTVQPSYIVGIGASAGGLEAIEQFFDHTPSDTGMAFVVVQHLSPDFKSMMDELLARHTEMPIHRIESGMALDANAIYLIPPKENMVISDGEFLLTDQDPQGLNLPIDIFLRSLAQEIAERAIAVILSGTGSDGSRGIREIHERGGLVIVQQEDTAKFDGMPRSAIATGVVDLELPAHAIPEALLNYLRHPLVAAADDATRPLTEESSLSAIYSLLRSNYGIDFTSYKPSTIGRRIERRLTLSRVSELKEYLRQLEADPHELELLYADLLIGVTEFFRDTTAFERLEKEVIPQIIDHVSPDNAIRVWAPGCATGEEAYSLAILLYDELQRRQRSLDVKIFATDVHQRSLDRASAGVYPEASVANLSPERLQRHFIKKEGSYQVSQHIRQMVIYATHNLIKDPPFTKIDLITCRNLLIYLQPLAQRKVVSFFHFALRTGGVLFLGPSETVGELDNEFDTLDQRWRIYRKRRDVRLPDTTRLPMTPAISMATVTGRHSQTRDGGEGVLARIYEMVTTRFAPSSILMNERRELVHVFGDAQKYLSVPHGQASIEVLKMVDGDLRLAISSATHRALKKDDGPVVYRGVRIETPERAFDVKLTVESLVDRRSNSTFVLICFEEAEVPPPVEPIDENISFDVRGESIERISQLERELQYTKEHLQTTIEELETSNEELQSTNEELIAANEELQSTNEELHSVNEELYTVNAEHQRKIAELTQLTDDMDNLLRSTEIGTVFVDRELHIRKFTPAISETINLMPQDVGRPIEHMSHNVDLGGQSLLEVVKSVLQAGMPIEREVLNRARTPLLMRVLPYRSQSDEVAGVVLSFVDIHVVKEVQEQLHESNERLDLALRSAGVGTWNWYVDGDTIAWDDYMFPLFGVTPDLAPRGYGQSLDTIHPDDRRRVDREVTNCLSNDAELDTQFRVVWPDESVHTLGARGKVYRDHHGKAQRMAGVCWDVTSRAIAEQVRGQLAAIVESSDDAILAKDLDGTIAAWNDGAQRLYGYTHEEAVGQSVSLIIPPSRPNELNDILAVIRKGERLSAFRTTRVKKDGCPVDVSITVSPIKDAGGQVTGASTIARDITQRIRAEDDLKESHARLARTNEELEQFAYVASHDLREPLRTVRSFCELFAENYQDQLDQQADKWIAFMIEGVARMQALIDDLLLYSRLESNAQPAVPTDLNQVLANVVSDMKMAIDECGAEITSDVLPTVDAEATQMNQLLQNLISNAVKYRSDQPPVIYVAADRAPGKWTISVRDNGIGIEAQFQDKVFELFKRLHGRDKYSGTGIGLAVCRKIVLRHGGKIGLDSQPGVGTTFYFTIPDSERNSDG